MPGLLDSLQDPGNALGLSLLAAGSPTSDPNAAGFGTRLNAAVVDATDKTLKQQLAASQLYAQKQKAALLSLAMQDGGAVGPGSVLGAAPSQAQGTAVGPATAAAPGAVLGGGGGSAGSAPAPVAAPAGSPGAGLFNPRTAALLKLGGEADILPNIQAMQPKWEFHDGVAIDVNPVTNPSFKGGPQGFVSKSADGKVIQGAMGADGQMHVAPVDGAVSAFNQFENASNESKAKNTESRQTVIGPTGRSVSQSVYDATRGVTPPAAGGPVIGVQPPVTAPPRAGGSFSSPGGLAGGNTATAAQGQREVLTAEIPKAQAALAAAQQAGDTEAAARAQQDLAGLQRELARLPGGAAPAIGLPPPSPVVANSAPMIGPRTNFANMPGQGQGVGGGTALSPVEQNVAAAAKAGAEEQAKQQAKAEANPNDTMKTSWQALQKTASGVPNALDLLAEMKKKSADRTGASTSYLGALPFGINGSQDAYDKARAQLLPMVTALAAGGGDATDASRATAGVAVPAYGVNKEAQAAALVALENQFKAAQIRNQALAPHFNSGNGQAYTKLETEMNANLTPTVAGIVSMPPGKERNAAAQAAVKADPTLVDKLRWAEKEGILK